MQAKQKKKNVRLPPTTPDSHYIRWVLRLKHVQEGSQGIQNGHPREPPLSIFHCVNGRIPINSSFR